MTLITGYNDNWRCGDVANKAGNILRIRNGLDFLNNKTSYLRKLENY